MKTTLKKLAALLTVLALALALCACGGTKEPEATEAPVIPKMEAPKATEAPKAAEAPAPAVPEETIAGYYKIVKTTEKGEEQDLTAMAEMGILFYIVLNDDGTGCIDMLSEKTDLKWNDKEVIFTDDNSAVSYTYKAGVLTLEHDGATMVCERLSDEEKAYYIENGSGDLESLFGETDWGDSPIPEGEPSDGPVSAELGDFTVTILGAEAVEDEDGDPAIRFWYEFTNNSDELASVFSDLFYDAAQDGEALDTTYLFDDVPEAENSSLMVAPDHTIRCADLFEFDPDGGTVAFRLRGWDEDAAIYYVDPANIFGAPDDTFAFVPDGSVPDFMLDAPDTDGSAYITDDITVEEDWDGNDMLRIFVSFTNNTEETTSFFSKYSIYAMQDGYELPTAFPAEDREEDENDLVDIAPGDSILCAFNFEIRSDSPISIVIEDFWGDAGYFGDTLVSD